MEIDPIQLENVFKFFTLGGAAFTLTFFISKVFKPLFYLLIGLFILSMFLGLMFVISPDFNNNLSLDVIWSNVGYVLSILKEYLYDVMRKGNVFVVIGLVLGWVFGINCKWVRK